MSLNAYLFVGVREIEGMCVRESACERVRERERADLVGCQPPF